MKKYLLTAVLAALAASPALAAPYHRADRSQAAANSAYDYAMPGAAAVVSNGAFLGSDPDANSHGPAAPRQPERNQRQLSRSPLTRTRQGLAARRALHFAGLSRALVLFGATFTVAPDTQ